MVMSCSAVLQGANWSWEMMNGLGLITFRVFKELYRHYSDTLIQRRQILSYTAHLLVGHLRRTIVRDVCECQKQTRSNPTSTSDKRRPTLFNYISINMTNSRSGVIFTSDIKIITKM